MNKRDKQVRPTSVTNQEADIDDTDRQKLYDGFVVLAKIMAREMAKDPKPFPDSTGRVSLAEKLVLSPTEAAKLMGLHTNTIYQLIHQNKIPYIRYARRMYIPHMELKKLINSTWNGVGH